MGFFNSGPEPVGGISWETIKNNSKHGPGDTFRAKVIGGWLVGSYDWAQAVGGLTFIPDPNHKWQLEPID